MSIEVKTIDTNQAKSELKKCPKIVQDYVRSLENVYEMNKSSLNRAISVTRSCTQVPTIIEIDFDGHLKCQIETTDKAPTVLKAVNGYGHPVNCNKDKIRINVLQI